MSVYPLSRRRFVAALGAGAAFPAAAEFRIEVSGVGGSQLPITVAPFRGESGAPQKISAIIAADLQRSGAFRSVPTTQALDENSNVDGPAWRASGVDALVAGSMTRGADGRWDLRYKLWDVVRNTQFAGQTGAVLEADLRLTAHRIADVIHEKLTGERGVNATRIAYVVRTGRRHTLHVTDADGEGGQVALTSPEPIISPAWAPNGRQLAYVSFETQKAVVYVQDLQTGERRPIANFRGSNSAPAWAPNGRDLVVTLARDGYSQLYATDASGREPRRLTNSRAIDTEAVYSPDGAQIYFVSDRGGGPQIYRMPAAGGNPERMSFNGSYNISPDVSPDGKLLAYVTRQGGNAFKLVTQEVDSGTLRTLTDTQDDESPSFAPNGRLLVYATRSNGRDVLMTTTLDGRIKTSLLSSGGDVREPAWGPFAR